MSESWAHAHRPSWADWGGSFLGGHLRLGPVLFDHTSCGVHHDHPRFDGATTVLEEAETGRRQTFGGAALRLGSSLFVVTVRGRSMFPSYALRRRWRRIRHPIASRRPAVPQGISVGGGEAMATSGPRCLP